MSKATEIEALRLLIKQDEQALTSLKAQETEIIEHVAPRGFQAATNRERVMSEAQIIESLSTRLARYKVPKRVLLVAELPRNAMGKVQKSALRATYAGLYHAS